MRIARFFVSAAAAAAVVTIVPQAPPHAAPDPSVTVVLQCRPGWQATSVGQYGGVGFEVSCRNGRGQQRLTGMAGSAYTVRTGVESSSIGGDCFWSGDAPSVSESCLDVHFSIR